MTRALAEGRGKSQGRTSSGIWPPELGQICSNSKESGLVRVKVSLLYIFVVKMRNDYF
jgi:hypothetical protein